MKKIIVFLIVLSLLGGLLLTSCQSAGDTGLEPALPDLEVVDTPEDKEDPKAEEEPEKEPEQKPSEEEKPEEEKPEKEEPKEEKPEKEEPKKEEPKEEEPKEDTPTDEDKLFEDGYSDADVIETDLDKKYEGWLKVASYNVQHYQAMGAELYDIGDEIKSIDPDIIGLQEIDMKMSRSGGEDQMKKMAEYLGYKYYYFGKSINSGGGEYGHGVMSKYPIVKSETIMYTAQHGEERSFEHHIINVNGQALGFYNTHLCLDGTKKTQNAQLSEVFELMKKDRFSILTGDMNATPMDLSPSIDDDKFYMLNGSDVYTNTVNTHPEGKKSRSPIDNIIVSTSLKFHKDERGVGVIVNRTDWSDHNMIYTYVSFK